MSGRRQVRLRLETRVVPVLDDGPATVEYDGISILCFEDDRLVGTTWVPVGDDPSYADDDALLAAWHAALRWSDFQWEQSGPATGSRHDPTDRR
ncbi:hypothetical protein M8542_48500 [Amycolatopsis sp. OK19-0408]|uniref:Uncharacterized protein n=1 Tax=Amycolatopsis iheyensis TaxID=2945988 RepID=A0A9X2NKT7_9PSEU|nr:hypothetical protein [Amycolatopsis iheyensis]MCR6490666.1 hypothetical protein [Amycolatopsis iheyensis]